jgi:hypothetical protein
MIVSCDVLILSKRIIESSDPLTLKILFIFGPVPNFAIEIASSTVLQKFHPFEQVSLEVFNSVFGKIIGKSVKDLNSGSPP